MLHEINRSEAGCLRTKDRTSPSESLSGKNTCVVLLSQLLVHSVHISDLATSYSDITGRNVLVRTDHFPELKHEGLAEAHDLSI